MFHSYFSYASEFQEKIRIECLLDTIESFNHLIFQVMTYYHKHKIFFSSDEKVKGAEWAWPFIDVKFYAENSSHIWNFDYHNIVINQRETVI